MADNPIKHSDIIQPGNPFDEMIKGLKDAIKLFKSMRKEVQATAQERIKTLEKTNTLTKEGQKVIKQVAAETKKLSEKDKELLRMEKAIEKEKAKLSLANSKQARELAVLKEQTRKATSETRNYARAQDGAKKSTNTWAKATGSFAAKFNTLGNVAAMALSRIVQNIKRAITQFISLDKIIKSNQESSDRFDRVMGRMKGSFEALNRAIAKGDFTNIGKIMKTAADAAEDYVRALDTLGDTQNAINIQTAKTRLEVFKLQEIYNNTNRSNEERMDAALKAEKMLVDLQEDQERVARMNYENEYKRIKDTFQLTDQQLSVYQKFIENYNLLTDDQITALEGLETQQDKVGEGGVDLTKSVRTYGTAVDNSAANINVVSEETKKYNAMVKELSQTLGFDVEPVMKTIIGTNDEARTKVVETTIAYYDQIRATQKLLNANAAIQGSILNKVDADNKNIESTEKMLDLLKQINEENGRLQEEDQDAVMPNLPERDQKGSPEADRLSAQLEEERQQKLKEEEETKKREAEIVAQAEKEKQAKIQATFDLANQLTTTFSSIFAAQKEKELSAVGDNAEKRAEIEKKYAKREQALAISQAVIDGASAVVKTWKNMGGFPTALPFAIAQTAITAAQIGIIASQKFAEGEVDINGPSHSRGGISAEIEGGESVINKRSTAKYKNILQAINANDSASIADAAIQNEAFHDVWNRTRMRDVSVMNNSDPYIKKMYEILNNTPVYVPDGPRKEYYPGSNRTRIING